MIAHKIKSIPKTMMMTGMLFGILMMSAACGEDAPPAAPAKLEFPIQALVQDDEGTGIAMVPVLIDGKAVGYTDREGKFAAKLSEVEGQTVVLSLGLVKGYQFPEDPILTEVLKASPGVDGNVQPVPVSLEAKMESTEVEVLIWVSADCGKDLDPKACGDIPIKVNDEVVANTNIHGRAHFIFKGTPNSKISVTLDTPTYSSDDPDSVKLEPAKPVYDLVMSKKSQVFFIEEGFKNGLEGAKSRTRRPTRKKVRRKVRRTVRKKKKRKKKKKRDDGVIDIFN